MSTISEVTVYGSGCKRCQALFNGSKEAVSDMQGRPLYTLEVIGGILPALGIAMNLRTLDRPGTLLWFVFGFILSAYLKLGAMPIAIIGFVIAFFYVALEMKVDGGGSGSPQKLAAATAVSTSEVASDDSDDDFE